MPPRTVETWGSVHVAPGERVNLHLDVSETYSGLQVRIPVHVYRSPRPGPVVFVTAAIHGDEVNGTGALWDLLRDPNLHLVRGSLIVVPVANPLAFDRHSRYLPDRRDLNRCFPGRPDGSLASRLAHLLFDEIVNRSAVGIDLHSAAVRRTNYPTVRADLSVDRLPELAAAFGTEVVLDRIGPDGSFRRESCEAGCPTFTVEAGEVWKVEPAITEMIGEGIQSVLSFLEMTDTERRLPPSPLIVRDTTWVRADTGGYVSFQVRPGDIVTQGDALATISTLLGEDRATIRAPMDGIIIGMSTMPATRPGAPMCHIAALPDNTSPEEIRAQRTQDGRGLKQVRRSLARTVNVADNEITASDDPSPGAGTT